MKIGSLFSGIGGLELGLEWSGLGRTVWQVERDPFCRNVLAKHWPKAKRYDDVCTFYGNEAEPVDLICGGFPCQDVSGAGKGAGLAGERSGLWREFARIVGEMRPEWVVVENVTSGASRWVDAVVCQLGELQYAALPVPLSASDVGAPHRRNRLFVVAHTDRIGIRIEQGRVERTQRPGQALANTNSVRQPQPQGRKREFGGRSGYGRKQDTANNWATEPDVGRVAHGIPARSHRLKALGNSVVPQCAEVVGWMIREMTG